MVEDRASLYIHVPFCHKKCGYCNFYVLHNQLDQHKIFLDTLKKEWELQKHFLSKSQVVSLYFGGGTPSLLGAEALNSLMEFIDKDNSLSNAEITVEANPEDLNDQFLHRLVKTKVNRLSVGGQTFNDKELLSLTRGHTKQQTLDGLKRASDLGFSNISCDIMYGVPHQTMSSFQSTLHDVTNTSVAHLSLYALTLEPATPFFRKQKELASNLPKDDLVTEMYLEAQDYLKKNEFIQYEISAYAKKGYKSHHNSGYWTGRPYLGLGPSSCSYLENRRFKVTPNFKKWLESVNEGTVPFSEMEILNEEERRAELFIVGLRMIEGVNLSLFQEKYGKILDGFNGSIDSLLSDNLLVIENNTVSLSPKGQLFYDTVASTLI